MQALVAFTLCLWAVTTMGFMASMGVGSGLFVLASLVALRRDREVGRLVLASPLLRASLAFFAAAALSLAANYLFPPFGPANDSYVSELKKFHYFLLPFLAAAALLRGSGPGRSLERHPVWKAIFWMGLVSAALGIAQFYAGFFLPAAWLQSTFFRPAPFFSKDGLPFFHAQGFMRFHLSYASAMSFVVAYALARCFWPLRGDTAKQRLGWRALAILSAAALFYSFSRTAWITLPVLVAFLCFLRHPRLGLASVIALSLTAILLVNFNQALRDRWQNSFANIRERQQVWLGASEMIKERPLLGVGFGKSGHYSEAFTERALGQKPIFSSHAHNNVLDLLAATGVIGFAAWLAWWAVLFTMAARAFRAAPEEERWLPAALLAGFLAFQVNGLTQVNFFDGKSQHALMLAVGVALALDWRRRARLAGQAQGLPAGG